MLADVGVTKCLISRDGVGSEKYKAALEYGKAVVLPAWVKDSAASGVALPLAKYRVAGASTSSPLAESRLPDMSEGLLIKKNRIRYFYIWGIFGGAAFSSRHFHENGTGCAL